MQTKQESHWVKSAAIDSTFAAATTPVIDVPAGTFVEKVILVITTAFGGGVPSIDVGDGDNDDGWIDTNDVTEGTKGAYVGDETTTAAYCLGKYYESADTIDVKVAAGLTSGAGYVLAHFLPMDEA